jgi:hypothetical protein
VAYDATHRRSGRCSEKAAAEHIACNAAHDGTSGRAFLLMGHPPGTTAKTDENCCCNCAD